MAVRLTDFELIVIREKQTDPQLVSIINELLESREKLEKLNPLRKSSYLPLLEKPAATVKSQNKDPYLGITRPY